MDTQHALLAGEILGLLLKSQNGLPLPFDVEPEVDSEGNYMPVTNIILANGRKFQLILNPVGASITEEP